MFILVSLNIWAMMRPSRWSSAHWYCCIDTSSLACCHLGLPGSQAPNVWQHRVAFPGPVRYANPSHIAQVCDPGQSPVMLFGLRNHLRGFLALTESMQNVQPWGFAYDCVRNLTDATSTSLVGFGFILNLSVLSLHRFDLWQGMHSSHKLSFTGCCSKGAIAPRSVAEKCYGWYWTRRMCIANM